MPKQIKLVKFIELRYADPISSLDLTDDYLLFGTMLGSTKLYIINQKKLINLSEIQDEFISGVKIYQNKLYICIGDFKTIIYNLNDNDISQIPEYTESKNYDSEEKHNEKCINCLSMLNDKYLIRTYINFPSKPDEEPITEDVEISIKNILKVDSNDNNNEEIKGNINMSNYSVPFDFDGKNYIFIDFIKQHERSFNVYNLIDKSEIKFIIEEKFKEEKIGHISHLKVIKDDLLFVVRDYNICEIRNYNLELKKKLNIKASEILAYDILLEENNNNNINNEEKDDEMSEKDRGIKMEKKDNDLESLHIILLDLDCNIFLYNYKEDKCELLFNLENDELGIDKDIQGQRFFLFGYPYYIKFTRKYIAISSDYGCVLFQYSSSD